jgi:hypothetical protein
VTLTLHGDREAGRWRHHCRVQPEGACITFWLFPFPVDHVTGTLEQDYDPGRREELRIDLAGLADGRRVQVKGTVIGPWSESAVAVRISGRDLPLSDRLMAALPERHQRVAADFHPTGLADFDVTIRRPAGRREFANHYLIHFHHAAVRYKVFPYPLEGVRGTLDVRPDHWEFHDFHGSHQGGVVYAAGRFQPSPAGNKLTVQLHGENVRLDQELAAALDDRPELKQAWQSFHPSGRMEFDAQVFCLGDRPPEVEVGITALGCTVKPDFFPIELGELTGSIHYARRWVSLENLQARHGGTVLRLDRGQIYLKPEGGVWADVAVLEGGPLVPDAELLQALPPLMRRVAEAVHLQEPVHLTTRLTLATFPGVRPCPDVYWEGQMDFQDATLQAGVPVTHVTGTAFCKGRYDGQELEGVVGNVLLSRATLFNQPFQDVQAAVEMTKEAPNVLVVPGLHARLFGGEVYGPVRVEFGPRPRYRIELTASQVQLEQFGRHNLKQANQVSGLANAGIYLTGQGADLEDLSGRGTIDVPNGRLYNLPPLLELLKFLSIRLPDGTAFEEAHADFSIHGKRVAVEQLDLYGNSISLGGRGEMNLNGTDVNLDLYAVWGRITEVLPPFIKEIPREMSKRLWKIKMRGQLAGAGADLHFEQEPVPDLLEPLKELRDRVVGRRGTPPSSAPAGNADSRGSASSARGPG